MTGLLQDKIAIVTGAGRGLGKAFALEYARQGAKLLLPDIGLERAEQTAAEIRAAGGQAAAMFTDISDEQSTLAVREKVLAEYGRADILLNNAALSSGIEPTPWNEWPVELWDRFFAINTRGTWLMCRAIAPLMEKQGSGKIVNIASDTIRLPVTAVLLPYACSKAAIHQLTQGLARALGASGICVNSIAPGLTETEATQNLQHRDEMFAGTLAIQCIKRTGAPADLLGTAVFLASAASDFVTGQLIVVDGGAVVG
jgi:NAD(P)-dependent dehydrogenase (short-subunit alcohol dehydrogenase family)